jgi:hypothetical protein
MCSRRRHQAGRRSAAIMFSVAVMSLVPFALVCATAATTEVPKSQSERRGWLIVWRRVAIDRVVRGILIWGVPVGPAGLGIPITGVVGAA